MMNTCGRVGVRGWEGVGGRMEGEDGMGVGRYEWEGEGWESVMGRCVSGKEERRR